MDDIIDLLSFDELAEVGFDGCPAFIHKDHRWVLCLIQFAQEQKWLPKPCTLIMFDAHHDALTPHALDKVRKLADTDFGLDELVGLCRDQLSANDDDWMIAGMELGLISDAIVFGVRERAGLKRFETISDHKGTDHLLALLGRVQSQLEFQGVLSDNAYRDVYSKVWDVLEWTNSSGNRFAFANKRTPFLLDFDLDCFAINWGDYTFPWPDEVFAKEFLTASQYSATRGWTGSQFVRALAEGAGMITICTEPGCCGGNLNVRRIVDRFNRLVFDRKLGFPDITGE